MTVLIDGPSEAWQTTGKVDLGRFAGKWEKAVRAARLGICCGRVEVFSGFLDLKEEDNIFDNGVTGIWWWYTGDEKTPSRKSWAVYQGLAVVGLRVETGEGG